MTSGIVSALDRTVEVPAENDSSALLVSAVQTDAAINPGNSGGALVNCSGDLIGVPTAGATVPSSTGESSGGSIGLGFAIPVDLAKTISNEIISTGRVTHAFFGLQTVPIPQATAAEAGISEGLFVAGVVAGGPAAKAGLRQGDVITKVDGNPATTNVQLQELTLTKSPGDKVTIDYVRDGKAASTADRDASALSRNGPAAWPRPVRLAQLAARFPSAAVRSAVQPAGGMMAAQEEAPWSMP